MLQEWKGIKFDHPPRERIYLYAMNEQIHELYQLENYFRVGVSVVTDSIDWRIVIADIFCDGSQGKGHQEIRVGRPSILPSRPLRYSFTRIAYFRF